MRKCGRPKTTSQKFPSKEVIICSLLQRLSLLSIISEFFKRLTCYQGLVTLSTDAVKTSLMRSAELAWREQKKVWYYKINIYRSSTERRPISMRMSGLGEPLVSELDCIVKGQGRWPGILKTR